MGEGTAPGVRYGVAALLAAESIDFAESLWPSLVPSNKCGRRPMACTFWIETDEKPLLFRVSDPVTRPFLKCSFETQPLLSSPRNQIDGEDADDCLRIDRLGSEPVDGSRVELYPLRTNPGKKFCVLDGVRFIFQGPRDILKKHVLDCILCHALAVATIPI
ncbi:uncharacterized protein PV07_00802 [Cladophialophora immunda]|uniref:Uncharacterized protein n=1 Tax=Cladophialophora immunda TaxID=569365 RepID=A0A0D2DEC9_9EURO|nr:uncharacterized protein PV07_00802 [Cladophialophora immunda]KIW33999.1 hypothetical protein PV07_00802 [Cladophialophora immunda]